jgi:hypothetical protein
LIQKHKTQDLYSHIKDVFRPGQSSGLQWVDIPKLDSNGNMLTDRNGYVICEVFLDAEDIQAKHF